MAGWVGTKVLNEQVWGGNTTNTTLRNSEGADRLEPGRERPMNLRMLSVLYGELEKKHEGRFPRHSNPQGLPVDGSELGRGKSAKAL